MLINADACLLRSLGDLGLYAGDYKSFQKTANTTLFSRFPSEDILAGEAVGPAFRTQSHKQRYGPSWGNKRGRQSKCYSDCWALTSLECDSRPTHLLILHHACLLSSIDIDISSEIYQDCNMENRNRRHHATPCPKIPLI